MNGECNLQTDNNHPYKEFGVLDFTTLHLRLRVLLLRKRRGGLTVIILNEEMCVASQGPLDSWMNTYDELFGPLYLVIIKHC